MTGYELYKQWPKFNRPSSAFIYRALSGLLKENFVELTRVDQEKRPDRNVFNITESGLAELDKWLGSSHRFSLPRSTMLVQIWFGARVGKNTMLTNLASYRDEIKYMLNLVTDQRQKGQTTRKKISSDNVDEQLKNITYDSVIFYIKSIDAMIDTLEKNIAAMPDLKPRKDVRPGK